jgi:hypothetical protein
MENKYPNWLIPIETAKKLKEAGFDEPCVCYTRLSYNETNISNCVPDVSYSSFGKLDSIKNSEHINDDITFGISLPTWEQVFEWFRNKGFMITLINYEDESKFSFYNMKIRGGVHYVGTFKTYEEAREELVNRLTKVYKENI